MLSKVTLKCHCISWNTFLNLIMYFSIIKFPFSFPFLNFINSQRLLLVFRIYCALLEAGLKMTNACRYTILQFFLFCNILLSVFYTQRAVFASCFQLQCLIQQLRNINKCILFEYNRVSDLLENLKTLELSWKLVLSGNIREMSWKFIVCLE